MKTISAIAILGLIVITVAVDYFSQFKRTVS